MVTKPNHNPTSEEKLDLILEHLKAQKPSVFGLGDPNRVYTNKEMMDLLGVHSRYLKTLRDNGYLGYSRVNDKYWYTQKQVDEFLHRFNYPAFTTKTTLPPFSKGGYV